MLKVCGLEIEARAVSICCQDALLDASHFFSVILV